MSDSALASRRNYSLLPTDVEGFDSLAELALDLRWSWNHRSDEICNEQHAFEVQVYLNEADPKAVCVELYADGLGNKDAERREMECVHPLAGAPGGYLYRTAVAVGRAAEDYTARLIARYDGVAIPLENARILWRR